MSAFDSGAFDAGAFEVPSGSGSQTLTQASRFNNSNSFYAATVTATRTLTATRYDNTQAFYAAVITQGGGPQILLPSLYTNGQTFYGPTVTATRTLTATRFDNAQSFYTATVGRGAVNLSPARFDNAQAFYGPVVTRGAVVLTPARFDNAQSFFAAVVSQTGGSQTLLPNRFDNENQFFAAKTTQFLTFPDWVEPGHVEPGWVSWPYFNTNQFFEATVEAAQEQARPHRVEITDYEPKLWWLRRPKAIPEEVAKAKVAKVAKTIQKVVEAKVEQQQEPTKREIKEAIAPDIQQMPGFDWVRLYQQILIQVNLERLAQEQELERQAQIRFEQDEEDALILLMA